MKFLILSPVRWNSLRSHAKDLAIALAKAGHKVIFVSPPATTNGPVNTKDVSDTSVPENIVLRDTGIITRYPFPFVLLTEFWYLSNVLRNRHATTIFYNVLPGVLTMILARLLRVKIVFAYVDDYEHLAYSRLVGKVKKYLVRLFCALSNRVVCTARVLCDNARRYGAKDVVYQPNAIVLSEFTYRTKCIREIKKIYFVGGLGEWVDVDAMIFLARYFPDKELHIIGDGPSKSILEEKMRKLHLRNVYLHGIMPHSEAMSLIARDADLGFIPFVRNPLTDAVSPIKLFEFIALRKPVVAARTKELEEFPGKIWLYSNYEEIVVAFDEIHRLLLNGEIDEILKENYRIVITMHDWNASSRTSPYLTV